VFAVDVPRIDYVAVQRVEYIPQLSFERQFVVQQQQFVNPCMSTFSMPVMFDPCDFRSRAVRDPFRERERFRGRERESRVIRERSSFRERDRLR
jgi:hypothetical protein